MPEDLDAVDFWQSQVEQHQHGQVAIRGCRMCRHVLQGFLTIPADSDRVGDTMLLERPEREVDVHGIVFDQENRPDRVHRHSSAALSSDSGSWT